MAWSRLLSAQVVRGSCLAFYAIFRQQPFVSGACSRASQAGGEKQKAVGLLQQCNAHPDRDVRKIADSVLYIMQVRRNPQLGCS
eukprot:1142886-Pleurochrysis_carterae.AAC.1